MRCTFVRRECRECDFTYEKNPREHKLCPKCGDDMQCKNYTAEGYKRCGFHGGPRPGVGKYGGGPAMTAGGHASTFPLTRLAAKRNEMQKDGRILSNRQSIEILNTRIMELAGRIDQNQAPDRLLNLFKLWGKFKKARYGGSDLEAISTEKELEREFEAAYHDYAAWKQMFEALDLHSRLVDSEVKLAKDLKAILTAEDAYELVADVFAVILNVEDDPTKLKRYQYELTRLVGDGSVVEAERRDREVATEE